jgi:biopolymer transport protein ExbB/TolQ
MEGIKNAVEFIAKFFRDGGPAMWPILVCCIFGVSIIIERAYYIFGKAKINARRFMNELSKLIIADEYERAIELCSRSPAPLCKLSKAAIEHRKEPERIIQNAVDEVALEELPQLQKRTHYLAMLANASTLLGLLGTIFGLIQCFQSVAMVEAAQKAQVLARGISIAMNTTAFGLTVGIPCLIGHSILQGNTEKVINDIDEYSVKLINLLLAKQR